MSPAAPGGRARPGERDWTRVRRARVHPPAEIYPVDPWRMRATSPHREMLAQNETIFATANGFLGLRGDHEENHPVRAPGVFLNGFYESWPIVYGESAYGFAKNGQTIVNVTDAKIVKLYVDDEPFELPTAASSSPSRATPRAIASCSATAPGIAGWPWPAGWTTCSRRAGSTGPTAEPATTPGTWTSPWKPSPASPSA